MPTGTLTNPRATGADPAEPVMFHDAFIKGLQEDWRKESSIRALFSETSRTPEGDVIKAAIGGAINPSVAHVNLNNGDVPTAGFSNSHEVSFSPGFLGVSLAVSDYVARLGKKFNAKYFDIMAEQYKKAKRALALEESRLLRGDGTNICATVSALAAADDMSVDSGIFLIEGKVYSWFSDASTPVDLGDITVDVVNSDGTIEVDATQYAALSGTPAIGDRLVLKDDYATDIHGFQQLADDGTLATTFAGGDTSLLGRYWEGNYDVEDPGTRTLNAQDLVEMAMKIHSRSGKMAEKALMNPNLVKELALQYTDDIRYKPSEVEKLGTGFKTLRIQAGGAPLDIIQDYYQGGPAGWAGMVPMWAPGGVEFWEYLKPTWRGETPDSSGDRLHRSQTKFSYLGELICGLQLMTLHRARLGLLGGYDVDELVKG